MGRSTEDRSVDDESALLLTDLYELTMLQAYFAEGMGEEAVFSLFVRRLPPGRRYLVACGLDDVLHYFERFQVSERLLGWLERTGRFSRPFLSALGALRFEGNVWAMPEGMPFFAEEPVLEVVAPLPAAQLAETFAMNQIHLQTVLASKAARFVEAAAGRPVVDFGLRRMHGTDAGLKGARAFFVAGLAGTSNVLASKAYGIPAVGTMAHSYVQAHPSELEAFRAFVASWPEATLLVDTYDTMNGVDVVIALARELGPSFRVKAVRLDSGDLGALARQARSALDRAGLSSVGIFASGGLDEHRIRKLVESGAPIDAFGVGSSLGTSSDAPALDAAYKLVAYAGEGRMKLSPDKLVRPGRKQVFRVTDPEAGDAGVAVCDVVATADEPPRGRPLLVQVMAGGRRTAAGRASLHEARERLRSELARLPAWVRSLDDGPGLEVRFSDELERRTQALAAQRRGLSRR